MTKKRSQQLSLFCILFEMFYIKCEMICWAVFSLSRFNTPRIFMNKKLIEVAIPLQAINEASGREKSIRHGHPSTLHLWWSRKPLATTRAVLWASLVDDPSAHPDRFPTDEAQARERSRLFKICEELVKWENSNDPHVLDAARAKSKTRWDPNRSNFSTHLPAADRFHSRRKDSDSSPMPTISIPSLCSSTRR